MREDDIICYCSGVGRRAILSALDQGAKTLQDIRESTGACTQGRCGELSPRKRCCSREILELIRGHPVMTKPKVAFICVHNSCRSQMAEALGKHLASDVFESYSAGTETRPRINPDAVRIMKRLYGIDMEKTQRSKLLEELPPADGVITMGCNVKCPYLPSSFREDWGLEDPTGKSDEEFIRTAREIEKRILDLRERLGSGLL